MELVEIMTAVFGRHHDAQVVWELKAAVTGGSKAFLGPKLEETEHVRIESSPKPDPVSLLRSENVAYLVHRDHV